MRFRNGAAIMAVMLASVSQAASADVRITEFMHQGANLGLREFIELTNLGPAEIDVSNWSYNDNNPNNPVSFGGFFGSIAAYESVILTEMNVDAFRGYWNLDDSVRIFSIGGDSNLGGSDTINIYSSNDQSAATLVDSLAYTGVVAGVSRNRPLSATGPVTNADFVVSAPGDAYGSRYAEGPGSDLANPGRFVVQAAVPEPAAWALMIGGFGVAGSALRRRRTTVRFA